MTGQPNDQSEKTWDEKTRALAACLEALLELHREQVRRPPPAPKPGGDDVREGEA